MFKEVIYLGLIETPPSTCLPRKFSFFRNGFGCGPGFIIGIFNNVLKGKRCLREGFWSGLGHA